MRLSPLVASACVLWSVSAFGGDLPEAPLVFEENRGQLPEAARFVARDGGLTAFFADGGARLVLDDGAGSAAALFLSLEGGDDVRPLPRGQAIGQVSSYRGDDPAAWVSGAPAWPAVRYPEAAPGVELVFLERDGRLSYDLVLAPGADAGDLVVRAEGASGLEALADGSLRVTTSAGDLVQTPPVAWERTAEGACVPVAARFVVLDPQRWRFDVERQDPEATLVIDPGLTWGSYLGGSLADRATSVAITSQGHVVVAGTTGSSNFPTSPGALQEDIVGFNDAFISRIVPGDGSFIFSTYLGGTDTVIFRPDVAESVIVGDDGFLLVAGTAASADFPTTSGAAQEGGTGGTDGFVARIHPGGFLVWSTRIGGAGNDEAMALAVDAAGDVTAVGHTFSSDFPTTAGAYDESFNSIAFTNDGWVARISADGSAVLWSTVLGGILRDELRGVALDSQGRAVVAGLSGSTDFPVTAGAYDESYNGDSASETDAVLARLSADGSALHWATFLGSVEIVEGNDLALGAGDQPVLVGETRGSDFPVTLDALQEVYGGGTCDGFVARLLADGSDLVWSTFLGGGGDDSLQAVALSSGDQATVVGSTASPELIVTLLPDLSAAASGVTTGASAGISQGGAATPASSGTGSTGGAVPFDLALGGLRDGLVARLASDARSLLYASFHGGSAADDAVALALEPNGAVWVVGSTGSDDLPVAGAAVSATPKGALDAFVARFAVPPVAWFSSGHARSGSAPSLRARGAFELGSPWSLHVAGATPGARGWLLVGPPGPGPLVGGNVVGPWPVTSFLPLNLDAAGEASLGGAAWPLPPGMDLVVQAWIAGPASSDALQITTP
jgi:hypothetical protein